MFSPYGSADPLAALHRRAIDPGIWAQIRVSSAFRKWGEVRASSNITGAECAREILQAAQISDVDVVETNNFLGDHYDPTRRNFACRVMFTIRHL